MRSGFVRPSARYLVVISDLLGRRPHDDRRAFRHRYGWQLMRPWAWLAWALVAITLTAATGSAVLGAGEPPWMSAVAAITGLTLFTAVGAIVVTRARNTVGWVMIGIGSLFSTYDVLHAWAHHLYTGLPSPPDHAIWVGWVASWIWVPGFVLAFVFLPLLFPDGRPPSPRWRPVVWTGAALLLAVPAQAVAPGPMQLSPTLRLPDNPLGVEGFAGSVAHGVAGAAEVAFLPVLVAVTVSLVVRWRRARGVERQQLKWVAAAAVGVAALFLLSTVRVPQPVFDALGSVVLVAMPVSIGVAVLRYRLYEIDRIVNRAVVYTLLTAALLGVYWAAVVGLGSVARLLTGHRGGDLVVAASTLAVAALYGPLRRRVQTIVDRRFDRARYDAERELARFVSGLRDEVDVERLARRVEGTAASTLRPNSCALWVPTGGPAP
jgi:hypothetical protein